MLQLIYELRKNCCGTGGREKSKVLQEVLADLKKHLKQLISADGGDGGSIRLPET